MPLFSPLPASRFKCNFSREGLRVELLLQSNDSSVNSRHLITLEQHLHALQQAFGPSPHLQPEPLPGKAQARLAAYLPGAAIADTARWPEYEEWFVDVLDRFDSALKTVPQVRTHWGG